MEECGRLTSERLNTIVNEIDEIFDSIQSRSSGGVNKRNMEEEQDEVNSVYSSSSSIS